MKLSIVLCTSSSSQLRKEISKWVALCVFLLQGVYKICRALHLMRAVVSTCLFHGACIACAAMPMSHVARAYIYKFKCVRRVCHFLPCGCKLVQRRGQLSMLRTPHWHGELRTYGERVSPKVMPLPTGGVESYATPNGPEDLVCTVALVLSSLLSHFFLLLVLCHLT